jgi:hypothetical protein
MKVRDPLWDVARLVITLLTMAVGIWAIVVGMGFRPLAAYFPVAAAAMIVVFGGIQFGLDLRNFLAKRAVVIGGLDVESPIHGLGAKGLIPALRYSGWFVGYLLVFYVTGAFVSSVLFVMAFLRIEAKWSWVGTAIAGVAVLVVSLVMVFGLDLALPRTMLDIGHDLF